MQPSFFCAWRTNIELGERVFFNFTFVVLDVWRVQIGSFTLFGLAVQIYTATHPLTRPRPSRGPDKGPTHRSTGRLAASHPYPVAEGVSRSGRDGARCRLHRWCEQRLAVGGHCADPPKERRRG